MRKKSGGAGIIVLGGAALLATAVGAGCGRPDQEPPLAELSLASKGPGGGGGGASLAPLSTVPVPQPVGGDIRDRAAAIRLGKALYWDVQTGGDGLTACASCHYEAGTDTRLTNVLNPGGDGQFGSGMVDGPGQTLKPGKILNDDRVGSQGVVGSLFMEVDPDPAQAADRCVADQTAPFYAHRRVTGRNAPPTLAAVFNRDNFWDGRANHGFNGANPFGATPNGSAGPTVANASLASQAVGPANNPVEMACGGRPFNGPNSLAAKLLARRPLQFQEVSTSDGVLGDLAAPGTGLAVSSYQDMIAPAFGDALAADSINQFSRIWGQAVQAYESTLIPDRTPLDRFLGGDRTALTDSQQRGLDRFTGKGGCIRCHAGAELTDASVGLAAAAGLINEDGGDQGFHNLGVRPTDEDLGRAGCPGGACDGSGPGHFPNSVSGSPMDRGAFKTPALRNVKLTGPYFHNGGMSSLEEVVDFYNRGGDFPNVEKARRIRPLSLDERDKAALVDFLRNGLTDCRVEQEQAPFDHPALPLPNGEARAAVGAEGKGPPCP
jgi:cytochrome c peroxidase